jgi:hypothetical protein
MCPECTMPCNWHALSVRAQNIEPMGELSYMQDTMSMSWGKRNVLQSGPGVGSAISR